MILPNTRTQVAIQLDDTKVVVQAFRQSHDMLETFVHKGGIYDFSVHYDVDFAVYSIGRQPRQALLGNRSDTAWSGAVTEREERQHILRVRGSGPFTTAIVLRRRDAKPARLNVTTDGETLVVTTSAGTTRIAPDGFTIQHIPAAPTAIGR